MKLRVLQLLNQVLKKLKNVTFKNIVLSTNIELFLEHHITSLRGMSLLKSNHSLSSKDTIVHNNNEIHSNKDNLPLYDDNETNKRSSPTYDNSRHSDKNKSPPYEKTNTAKINLPTYYPDSHSDDIDDNSPRYEEFDLDRGSLPKNVYTYSDSGDSPPHKHSYLSKINNIECDSIEKCLSTSNLENLKHTEDAIK